MTEPEIELKETESLGILWGARQIGEFIGKPPRATFHLLETGQLPARKHGKLWTSTKSELAATFGPDRPEGK
jgi:hypothetical protein